MIKEENVELYRNKMIFKFLSIYFINTLFSVIIGSYFYTGIFFIGNLVLIAIFMAIAYSIIISKEVEKNPEKDYLKSLISGIILSITVISLFHYYQYNKNLTVEELKKFNIEMKS